MRPRTACSLLAFAAALPAAAGAAPTRHRAAHRAPAAAPALPPLALRDIPTQLPKTVRPAQYALNIRPDAAKLAFAATATIDIDVLQPVKEITLNAVDMQFGRVTLAPLPGNAHPMAASDVHMDEAAQTATMTFPSTIHPGRYRLVIDYRGRIYQQAAGFFALDYDSASGRKRALFTQFEAPDARRFFPGWDEPRFRTPYTLTVTVPAENSVVGNMPAATVKPQPGGLKTITFMTTPAMSSYLVFFATGDFDRITTRAAGTEIGVVTRRGNGEQGRWALQSAARILPFYNHYFGTPFPLPKLDNVAGPGSSQFFGAMENWGAIFTFENVLLLDPAITSEASRQRIFGVAAHEMAHQWFGDLVTMAWWDDIWLNEGFASWMATKSTAALHPEWHPELGLVDSREAAMRLDSVATTHPVVQHIATVDQMSQAFDTITYQKGEAVITMLEDYVGSETWRRGIQAYIRAHRLSNAQSDDLWAAIEAAAHKPVTAIAHDFTLQPGIPLIRVTEAACRAGRTELILAQEEYSRDRPDKAPLRWRVPVIAASLGGAEARTVVSGGHGRLSVPGCGPLLVNEGQTGYYRTLYTPAMLRALTGAYARLKPIDQIGLLADNWSLGLGGYESPAVALDMTAAAPADANPALDERVAGILRQIYELYAGDEARQAAAARYASAKLGPVFRRLGWRARPNEPAPDAVLRADLIGALGAWGDPEVVAEARRLYETGDPLAKSGPLRTTILAVVARNVDAAGWDRLHEAAKAEHNPLVRAQLYRLLGSANDPALAQRALDLALTDEPGPTTSPNIIAAVAAEHPDLAFDFALAHKDRVESLVDASSRSRYLPGLAAGSSDPAMIARLQAFADRYMTPQSRRPADIAIASIRDRVKVRETRRPDITRWLDAHGG
ncbi:MAG TPA: M1 family metallopeptidase [Allosphingosinicella sp.]|nr:M1 family metallopeptidase [Allosphingosinicella sp.]